MREKKLLICPKCNTTVPLFNESGGFIEKCPTCAYVFTIMGIGELLEEGSYIIQAQKPEQEPIIQVQQDHPPKEHPRGPWLKEDLSVSEKIGVFIFSVIMAALIMMCGGLGWEGYPIMVVVVFVVQYYLYKVMRRPYVSENHKREDRVYSSYKERYQTSTSGNYPENWEKIAKKVKERDGYECGNCGSKWNLHAHHIVPLSKGGSNELGNLRTLCEDCHKKLHPHMV